MAFVVDALGRPAVSKNSDENWENDAIQFARLIAEMEAVGYFARDSLRLERALLESMDLEPAELSGLIERAQEVWDDVKGRL